VEESQTDSGVFGNGLHRGEGNGICEIYRRFDKESADSPSIAYPPYYIRDFVLLIQFRVLEFLIRSLLIRILT
jgi:hypothetical protein